MFGLWVRCCGLVCYVCLVCLIVLIDFIYICVVAGLIWDVLLTYGRFASLCAW